MKKLSLVQYQILEELNAAPYQSGSVMGQKFGISRTAIWKNISHLIDLGIPIKRLPQQGYQLTKPFIPLQEEKIKTLCQQPFDFHIFSEIDSTNRYLKDLHPTNIPSICCAEFQTEGRGRFGRQWVSPFGDNVYFSYRQQIDCCLSKLAGLSLVLSLAVHDCLGQFTATHDIQVKWPNDLIWQDRKLAGILVEIVAESNSRAQIIIGIGLNVNTHNENSTLSKSWCTLSEIAGKDFDRNIIIANLANFVADYIQEFLQHGFLVFLPRWQLVDYLYGKQITVNQANRTITGEAKGVNEIGNLILRDAQDYEHCLASGDTSLKTKTIG